MSYRLAVFDVDGTLVGPGGVVPKSAATAIAALPRRGVRVAPVTNRAFPFARREFREFGLSVPAIAAAGADVRAEDGGVIRQITIRPDCTAFLARLFDLHGQRGFIATTERVYTTESHDGEYPPPALRPVPSMVDRNLHNVLLVAMSVNRDDPTLEQLRAWEGEIRVELVETTAGRTLAVVTHATATREAGLLALCAVERIPLDESVVFVDGPEDIPLMQAAGMAVAMGDAPDEVKEHADLVTLTRDEGGIAAAIREIWG